MRKTFATLSFLAVMIVTASFLSPTAALAGANNGNVIVVAKNAGQIGERPDGYLGFVTPNVDESIVRAVRQINIKRKALYGDQARASGATIEQVAAVSAEKSIARVKPGQKYMNKNGQWVTK